MKKILLSIVAALCFSGAANAQLANGTVFPDFTLTSITGQTLHLYALLDSGYTVFIDVSATWCPPCWAYHTSGQLDTLYKQHGPRGWANVESTTTNNVVVIFVQGETTSHLAELYGDVAGGAIIYTTTELPYSNVTQGNWVAGTSYPIVDDTTSTDPSVGTAALDAAWHISYFPTVYMICRDHLVQVMTQPSAAVAYAASQATCPTYAPSTTVNAKATPYQGNNYYYCNAAPSVSFQNYGASTITTATVTVTDATGATVATQPWTGSLAPYAVANVTMPSFAGSSFGGYKFSVNVAGDTYAADNASVDSIFKVYAPTNATAVPYSENFEGATLSYKYFFPDTYGLVWVNDSITNPSNTSYGIGIMGTSGTKTNTLIFDNLDATNYYGLSNHSTNFIFGNYNVTRANLSLDVAYEPKTGATSNDQLQVLVSTNCGSTWSTAWSATGSALNATTTTIGSNWFVPSTAGQWKHEVINLSSYASNDLMIQIASVSATSGNGELMYVDNLQLTSTVDVPTVTVSGDITLYPNPARDLTTVRMNLLENAKVTVQVIDALGRVLSTVEKTMDAGTQEVELSTATLPTGVYNVKVAAGSVTTVQQLTIVK